MNGWMDDGWYYGMKHHLRCFLFLTKNIKYNVAWRLIPTVWYISTIIRVRQTDTKKVKQKCNSKPANITTKRCWPRGSACGMLCDNIMVSTSIVDRKQAATRDTYELEDHVWYLYYRLYTHHSPKHEIMCNVNLFNVAKSSDRRLPFIFNSNDIFRHDTTSFFFLTTSNTTISIHGWWCWCWCW